MIFEPHLIRIKSAIGDARSLPCWPELPIRHKGAWSLSISRFPLEVEGSRSRRTTHNLDQKGLPSIEL